MNLINPKETPYRAARRAHELVRDLKRKAERLKAADESTLAQTPDQYDLRGPHLSVEAVSSESFHDCLVH